MSKYTNFEYGVPVEAAAPNLTLFLNDYDNNVKVGVKRKAPTSRKELLAREKISRTSIRDQKITTRERKAAKHTIRSRASSTFSISIKQSGRINLFNFADVSLLSSEIAYMDFVIRETHERKIVGEPLYEPTTTNNHSRSNERQHQVIFCPMLSCPKILMLPVQL